MEEPTVPQKPQVDAAEQLKRLRDRYKRLKQENEFLAQHIQSLPTVEDVRRLQSDLWEARRQVLDMISDSALQAILTDYHGLARHEVLQWQHLVASKVVEIVMSRPTPDVRPVSWEPRVPCPLCNDCPQQHDGWLVPGGLELHLLGERNVRQCTVLKIAVDLAKESVISEEKRVASGGAPWERRNKLILEWEAANPERAARLRELGTEFLLKYPNAWS